LTPRGPKLVVGVLGMPDNEATARMLDHLICDSGLLVDFVVYWRPSPKDQWRRLVRKVRAAGPRAALQRVRYALGRARRPGGHPVPVGSPRAYREYRVPGHNSPDCRRILEDEGVDVLILSTDAIIGANVLRIPRVATLNVHPGWIPRYRGLGSNLFAMERGELPAVSVHAVDEGVDTGPLIVRERVHVEPGIGLAEIEERVDRRGLQLLADVIRQAEKGDLRYVDTFTEPSGMTRGMSAAERRHLDARLQDGRLVLS
jgi:folate-dependent phosphoribosylglycinamide formyltransferase PurN